MQAFAGHGCSPLKAAHRCAGPERKARTDVPKIEPEAFVLAGGEARGSQRPLTTGAPSHHAPCLHLVREARLQRVVKVFVLSTASGVPHPGRSSPLRHLETSTFVRNMRALAEVITRTTTDSTAWND